MSRRPPRPIICPMQLSGHARYIVLCHIIEFITLIEAASSDNTFLWKFSLKIVDRSQTTHIQ